MTENDLSVAKDIGALQSDMRTVKHDVSNISSKIDAIGIQIGRINTREAKGLGFWAGVLFVFTTGMTVAGAFFALIRSVLAGHGA